MFTDGRTDRRRTDARLIAIVPEPFGRGIKGQKRERTTNNITYGGQHLPVFISFNVYNFCWRESRAHDKYRIDSFTLDR